MTDLVEPPSVRLRDLHPYVWRVVIGFAFSSLGSGLTMPYLYVYLATVRGLIALSDTVDGWLAVAAVVAGLGLFGVGETLWAPMAPALVNGLAREDMRGRYNALQGMSWTVASIIGPATAGTLIGHDLPGVWVACVVGGTAASAVLFSSLRRHLTDAQDGLAPMPT